MTDALARIVRRFQSADKQTRLELLLDYSKKLPDLPAEYQAARDAGLNRVPEVIVPWVVRTPRMRADELSRHMR